MKTHQLAALVLFGTICLLAFFLAASHQSTIAQAEFIKHTLLDNVVGARAVTAADLNGDGRIDIVAASPDEGSYRGQIVWWENGDSGSFSKHIIDDDYYGAWTVDTADFDNDGWMDVVGATFWGSPPTNKLNWWKNNGDGTFTKQVVSNNPGLGFWSVHAADLDNDGNQDILTADYSYNLLSWWKNDGSGQFTYGSAIEIGLNHVSSVYAADLWWSRRY